MKELSLLFVVVFALQAAMFAGSKPESVRIYEPVTVGSTTLAPGTYNVAWTGTGSDVKVTFSQNKKEVAVVPATVVAKQSAATSLIQTKTDTGKSLDGIDFKNESLTFTPATTAASGSAH